MKKGITLISLVITIILLLILATVAINLAVDSDGLFSKAGTAANSWNSSVTSEETELDNLMLMANSLGGTQTPPPPSPSTLPEGWNEDAVVATVEEGDRIAPIPAGFVASKVSTEDEISEGLVIYQTNIEVNDGNHDDAVEDYNQYVWIPVDDINDMVMCSECGGSVENLEYDDETKTLSCTSTHAEGTTPTLVGKLYVNMEDGSFDADATGQSYEGEYREPAALEGDEATLITQMQKDFNDMAKSVAKYGGFYISRYEIGENGQSKKGLDVLDNTAPTDWYTLQSTLRKTGTSTTSQMIWGSQYDQVIKFIGEEAEEGHSNRNLSDEPALSGANPDDEMKNIYDLEGNYGEWTAEADYTDLRVSRGR